MLNHFCLVAFRYLHFLIENTLGSSLYHWGQYIWVTPFVFLWLIFSLKQTGRRYILIGSFFWTLWDNEFIPAWQVPWVILLLFSFCVIKNTWVYYTQVLNFCKRIFFFILEYCFHSRGVPILLAQWRAYRSGFSPNGIWIIQKAGNALALSLWHCTHLGAVSIFIV